MKFKNNLIAVIVPIYNREKYIEECLQSIFNQTYQNFEIIIVDDGSSDNSYKICESIAQKDKRIKLFATNHGGVSAARNIALDNITGEFVFFLDSDDVIHPVLLETLVNGLKTNNADIAGTNVVTVQNNNWDKVRKKLATTSLCLGETEYHDSENAINCAINQKSPLGCIGGVMMRSGLIGDTRFAEDIHIGEDFYFIYQNLIKNASAVFLKQSWYYTRIHENNSSWDWGYTGFWTRFYRRKLVWESEEALGRIDNANAQKRAAFGCYILCVKKNKIHGHECKKMRKVLKKHKNTIIPVMSFKGKILYLMCIYLPVTAIMLLKLREKLSASKNKK